MDYHVVVRDRLRRLLAWLQQERPDCRGRAVVDTAPLLERDFARRAGLGWFGKNTMLLNKRLGSYIVLGALLVDCVLRPDPIHTGSHCGSCISYLTIEHRGAIPVEWRSQLHGWLFGCDICQEVCPWNRKAPPGLVPELQARPDLDALDLRQVMQMSEADFRVRFEGTALMRTRRRGLLRNAALLLGAAGDSAALPALRAALADDDEVVREAARWAIGQIEARQSVGGP
jgi:epoxyqueuosine reductase